MRRFLLVLSLAGLLAVRAAARAGGGESYSGGSSFGGGSYSYSSGGSSSGSGDLFYIFFNLYIAACLRNPVVGIPLNIFLIYMIWLINREVHADPSGSRSVPGGSTRGAGQLAARKAEELARLRERDPAFSEKELLRRAGAAFHKIQDAWSAGDMGPARAFVSDGVRERFERQLSNLKARGLRNLMEGVEVRDIELLACFSDRHYDELSVRVEAAASDRMVDEAGETVSGAAGRQSFEEVWTFLRRPGAKSLARPGLIEGSCPSCGSTLPIADSAQCAACKSWVNSGEYDWVVSEITQSCEWVLRDPTKDIDGWAHAAAGDAALNIPALEDRASVIFWRWLDARRLGDAGPLRAVAEERFCAEFPAAGGWSEAFANAAVGAVEVVAFEEDGPWRRVHVGVKWSAAGELRRHFFVLSRASEAKTDARQGLRTARCPSCGAPPAEGAEAACAYCSKPLNDGRKDWVLTAVVPFGEWKRPAGVSVAAGRTQPAIAGLDWGSGLSPVDAYGILARAMLADGEESLAEKAFLQAYARSRGLPPARAAEISTAARSGLLDAPKAENGSDAETMLHGMIRMSLSDGIVTEDERAALHSFAARFGLRPDDVTLMISEQGAAMGRAVRGVS